MKKIALVVTLIAVLSVYAFAGPLSQDGGGSAIQIHAPNGTLSTALTVNDVTKDLTKVSVYSIYSPTAGCQMRLKKTAATSKALTVKEPLVISGMNTFAKNPATPFVTISGCTAGIYRAQ